MKRKQKKKRTTRLRVESLERRMMLDGNVSADVIGGMLFVRGDSADNGISILPGTTAGQYIISGTDTGTPAGSHPTTINGQSTPQTLSDVRWGMWANLGGGNDNLQMGNTAAGAASMDVPHFMFLFTGSGNSQVNVDNVTSGFVSKFKLGSGADSVKLNTVAVDHLMDINALGTEDFTATNGGGASGFLGLRANTATIVTGGGADRVTLDHTTLDHHIFAALGAGDDNVTLAGNNNLGSHAFFFLAGPGNDAFKVTSPNNTAGKFHVFDFETQDPIS